MNDALVGGCITGYSLTVELARRLVVPFLRGIGRRRGWNLDERQRLPTIVREFRSRTVVWVHAASLGEAKLLKRFLAMLEARNPDDCYVVTATTRSGVEYLERMHRPSVIAVGFLPLDSLPLMRSLLRAFNVSRVWLLETELWPGMLWACFTALISVGIANARIEQKSFTNYRRLGRIIRPLLQRLDVVMAQNETYATRFLQLGVRAESLHIVGNMKGYVRIRRPAPADRARLRTAMNCAEGDIVITAGCFHAGEGNTLSRCLDELRRRGRACKCIVVPRHLDDADALSAELGPSAVSFRDIAAGGTAWERCLVVKLGVLDAMYRIADVAIVGGTFVNIGGHNVWEPAQFGIPVFFGPHYQSQSSGCEKLLAAGVGFQATTSEELTDAVERTLWLDPARFAAAQTFFAEQINQQHRRTVEPLIP